jgi:hypothetical protein
LQVLKHMMKERPINANRAEFVLQAEAFARLVGLECVKMEGMLLCTTARLHNSSAE